MSKLPTFEPIGDRVVVQRRKAAGTTKGGIVLPDAVRETEQIGTIVAVGPGALRSSRQPSEPERYPMQAQVGDKVILPPGAPIIKLDEADPETEIVVCPEHALLAIVHQKLT